MAAAPDNGMLRPSGPAPLGAILVQRGVLTEEQLAFALDEQKRTGEQIGEVIVRLGLALAPSVAQALATQHGSPLKTEYGYAVGFGGHTPAPPADPPPVSPAPALDRPATAPAASALRTAAPPEVAPTQTPVSAPAATAAVVPTPPAPDPNLVQWQQYAQRLTVERDAALQEARTLAAEREAAGTDLDAMRARAGELEATTARLTTELETLSRNRDADMQRVAELEQRLEEAKTARAQAVELEAAQAEHIRARDESAQRVADLEQQLNELQSAASRVVELEATTTLAEVERARLTRARDDAARRSTELAQQNAELERQLTELRTAAVSDNEHLAAATARTAELEAAQAARESELGGALAGAREEAERIKVERAALEATRESLARRNADLEKQLKQLEAVDADVTRLKQQVEKAAAQIAQLEAERNDALAVAKALGEDQRGRHPGEHAEDSSHLLFIPGADGYRLLEQKGPPPAPGSTLVVENDGRRSRLLVAKVGAAPLPGVRLACAYLIVAA